jgi:hypothetical protein
VRPPSSSNYSTHRFAHLAIGNLAQHTVELVDGFQNLHAGLDLLAVLLRVGQQGGYLLLGDTAAVGRDALAALGLRLHLKDTRHHDGKDHRHEARCVDVLDAADSDLVGVDGLVQLLAVEELAESWHKGMRVEPPTSTDLEVAVLNREDAVI